MIRTEALTKFYGNRCAVRDLSVTIESQEIVGFLGLNGAGKTTTLRMLAGLLAPSSGSIEIDGQRMDASSSSAARWRIGFLPERPPVYEEMTIKSYLEFAARLRGYDESRLDARVDQVIEITDIAAYRDEVIRNLSHGYRQRVGIGQAIIHDPALVILDEPTTGLDPKQIREMRSLIRNLKEQHTVLLSSHNLPEIQQVCDRLLVIKQGELVHSGSEADLAGKLSGGQIYLLHIAGTKDAVTAALDSATSSDILTEFEVHDLGEVQEVRATLASDTPDALAKHVIDAQLGLRRLEPQANELESLFLELTRSQA